MNFLWLCSVWALTSCKRYSIFLPIVAYISLSFCYFLFKIMLFNFMNYWIDMYCNNCFRFQNLLFKKIHSLSVQLWIVGARVRTCIRVLVCLKRSKRIQPAIKLFRFEGGRGRGRGGVCASFYSEQYITLHSTNAASNAKLQLQREKRRNRDGGKRRE